MSDKNSLVTGKIRTSFGIKGYVKIYNFSGESEHFFKLKQVTLKKGDKSLEKKIEGIKAHGKDLVIKFQGIETPEEAKKYIDWEIWVPREKASPLHEGEFYTADFYGCSLIEPETKKVYGKVVSILYESGTTDYLEIESSLEEGKKFLIPFCNQYIGEVDIEKKTIELLAEWIIP